MLRQLYRLVALLGYMRIVSSCILACCEILPHFKNDSCLNMYTFTINTTYFSPSESNVKPVEEEAADTATITAPTKPQNEGHQASAGEVNGFISPSEETPSAPQSAVQDRAAVAPSTLPDEVAVKEKAPPEKPASLQEGKLPQGSAVSSQNLTQPQPQVEVEHQPRLPTNGFSMGSTETSALSPSSLTDSDLLEAVLDSTSSLEPEKLMSEEPAGISINVEIRESPLPNLRDSVTQSSESNITQGGGQGETSDKISHLSETVGQEKGQQECEHITVKTLSDDEVVSSKHSDPKSNVTTQSEEIDGWDVPDGLQSEDQPSVSEAVPPPPKPEPKKQHSLFKRNKKKSNQGNPSIHLNKEHVWNASLLTCFKGKSLFLLFLSYLTFYIMYGLF